MALRAVWCDEFVRLDPLTGAAIDGDAQAPADPPVRLTAARNEFASFQLLVGPVPRGDAATVTARSLKGRGRNAIGAAQADVYVEWYTCVDEKWYPEVCVPQALVGGSTPAFRKQNAVPGARFAGFWVDLFVPADARPGDYAGSVTVAVGGEKVSVPVDLRIVGGRIGADCCLDVSMNNYADAISRGWPELQADREHLLTDKYRRVERGVFRAAHEHRAFLHYLPYGHSGFVIPTFAPPVAGEGAKRRVTTWADWDRHFGGYFDGSAFRGTRRGAVPVKRFYLPLNLCWPADFIKFGQPGYAAEWGAVGRQIVDHFRRKGWTRTRFDLFLNHKQRYRFFPWDTEEVRFLPDNDLHRYFRTLWEGTFDRASTRPLKFDYTLGTTWTYHIDIKSDLREFIDVYIAGTGGPAWYPEELPKLHRLGRQVWSCTHSGSVTASTRAAWFTPLLMWMRDLDGFMPNWCSLLAWGGEPWRALPDRGASTFFYPGAEFGSEDTFASLRLKVLRNGLQVVDELAAAAGRPAGRKAVQRKVSSLLRIPHAAWFMKRPAYVDKKLPKDWVGADYATEEPPAAGWERFSTAQYRALRSLAARLVSGGAR